jgi:hypothetical protein
LALAQRVAIGLLDLLQRRRRIVGDLNGGLGLAAVGADRVAGDEESLVGANESDESVAGVDVLRRLLGEKGEGAETGHAQACHGGDEVVPDRSGKEIHVSCPGCSGAGQGTR